MRSIGLFFCLNAVLSLTDLNRCFDSSPDCGDVLTIAAWRSMHFPSRSSVLIARRIGVSSSGASSAVCSKITACSRKYS